MSAYEKQELVHSEFSILLFEIVFELKRRIADKINGASELGAIPLD